MNLNGVTADELVRHIVTKTGLMAAYLSDNTPETVSKRENLSELLNGVKDFVDGKVQSGESDVALSDFLGEVSLATDQDSQSDDESAVTLMTVHAAKGLEFSNVFIVGAEEELFPAAMSMDSAAAIEEERRLMYVAITRAKINCSISYARSRFRNGQTMTCRSLPFYQGHQSSLSPYVGWRGFDASGGIYQPYGQLPQLWKDRTRRDVFPSAYRQSQERDGQELAGRCRR